METLIQIDQNQALQQLSTLSYKEGDPVFLRFFYPRGDKRQRDDKGRSLTATFPDLPWAKIEKFQQEGRGAYFVVNGGGNADRDVDRCRAVFYEHDDLEKDLSRELWRSLGLPEPTLQIDTGGKSIHSYWVFSEAIETELWSKKIAPSKYAGLQPDLLAFSNADPALKNPSRVMRLAGCFHIKPEREPIMTSIVSNSGKRYSYEELREIAPEVKHEKPEPKSRTKKLRNNRIESNRDLSDYADLRDLAPYIPGYNPNGRNGWITCQCPVHGATEGDHSFDSLHIAADTGHFHCHKDCDGNEIYEAAKKLAGIWEENPVRKSIDQAPWSESDEFKSFLSKADKEFEDFQANPEQILFDLAKAAKTLPRAELSEFTTKTIKAAVETLSSTDQKVLWQDLGKATGLGKKEIQAIAKREYWKTPEGQARAEEIRAEKESEPCEFLKIKQQIEDSAGGELRLNQLNQSLEFQGEEINPGRYKTFVAELINQDVPREDCVEHLGAVGEANAYHPVKTYLENCYKKYGDRTVGLLEDAAERLLKPKQKLPIYNTYLRRWMIGAVARIYEPGCKFDHALILQGAQGMFKSTFLRVLAGDQFFDDNLGDLGALKDELLLLHMAWVHEWAEFDRVTGKREASLIKSFITRTEDRFRAPYDRAVTPHKRRSVLCGTVNDDAFLIDDENRRFWVIPLGAPADIELTRAERDQLWAAAIHLYKTGELPTLSSEESRVSAKLNSTYQREDTWEDLIAGWVSQYQNTCPKSVDDGNRYFTLRDLLEKGIGITPERQTNQDQKRAQRILKRMGHESAGKQRLIKAGQSRPVNCWKVCTGSESEESTGTTPVQTSHSKDSSHFEESTGTTLVQTSHSKDSSYSVPVSTSNSIENSEKNIFSDNTSISNDVEEEVEKKNSSGEYVEEITGTEDPYQYNPDEARVSKRTSTRTGKQSTGTPVQPSVDAGFKVGDRVLFTKYTGEEVETEIERIDATHFELACGAYCPTDLVRRAA